MLPGTGNLLLVGSMLQTRKPQVASVFLTLNSRRIPFPSLLRLLCQALVSLHGSPRAWMGAVFMVSALPGTG